RNMLEVASRIRHVAPVQAFFVGVQKTQRFHQVAARGPLLIRGDALERIATDQRVSQQRTGRVEDGKQIVNQSTPSTARLLMACCSLPCQPSSSISKKRLVRLRSCKRPSSGSTANPLAFQVRRPSLCC